jgi:hypothetical protein
MFNTVAIMQPTYLPWLGYFSMIAKADAFVFLDDVQFNTRSWQQRNRIKSSSGPLWLTIPVNKKGKSSQMINEVLCQNLNKVVEEHILTIKHNYRKAPFYEQFYSIFCELIRNAMLNSYDYLANFNVNLIKTLCAYFDIKCNFLISSDLNIEGEKDMYLANICEFLGAKSYLSAPGSKIYLDTSDAFKSKGIEVSYHDYSHPKYHQLFGDFIENMSCIDAVFNIGKDQLLPMIIEQKK